MDTVKRVGSILTYGNTETSKVQDITLHVRLENPQTKSTRNWYKIVSMMDAPRMTHGNVFLGKKMKLFKFRIEVRDGEHEYWTYQLVKARTQAVAERKAKRYAKTFLGTKMEWTDDRTLEPVDAEEYRIIRFVNVEETTLEDWLQHFYI